MLNAEDTSQAACPGTRLVRLRLRCLSQLLGRLGSGCEMRLGSVLWCSGPFVYEVSLVADQDDDDIAAALVADLLYPPHGIEERLPVCAPGMSV